MDKEDVELFSGLSRETVRNETEQKIEEIINPFPSHFLRQTNYGAAIIITGLVLMWIIVPIVLNASGNPSRDIWMVGNLIFYAGILALAVNYANAIRRTAMFSYSLVPGHIKISMGIGSSAFRLIRLDRMNFIEKKASLEQELAGLVNLKLNMGPGKSGSGKRPGLFSSVIGMLTAKDNVCDATIPALEKEDADRLIEMIAGNDNNPGKISQYESCSRRQFKNVLRTAWIAALLIASLYVIKLVATEAMGMGASALDSTLGSLDDTTKNMITGDMDVKKIMDRNYDESQQTSTWKNPISSMGNGMDSFVAMAFNSAVVLSLLAIVSVYFWEKQKAVQECRLEFRKSFLLIGYGKSYAAAIQTSNIQDFMIDQDPFDLVLGLYDAHIVTCPGDPSTDIHLDGIDHGTVKKLAEEMVGIMVGREKQG